MTDLIVDANSIYARAFYAAKGQPYDILAATLNMAIMLFSPNRIGERADRSLFCWDGGQKKAKERAERPPEYEDTKQYVKEALVALFGAPQARLEGLEADDLIATAATLSPADHVIIASADKDLHQLNSEKISIFDVTSKGFVSRREILAKWHVKQPSHVALALAIQGDSADKISGIKGWGPKKVEALFEDISPDMEFSQVLDNLLAKIPQEKHEEFLESLDLTLLRCDIEGIETPAPVTFAEPDYLEQQGLSELVNFYRSVYSVYHQEHRPRSLEHE